jgi:hypothetical protein
MPPQGIRIAGNPSPIPVGIEVSISTTNGTDRITTYKGETSQMIAAFGNLIVGSQEGVFRQDGAVSTITVRTKSVAHAGQEEVSRDTLDLQMNESQKSIFSNPEFAGLTANDIFDIQTAESDMAAIPGNDDTARANRLAVRTALAATPNGTSKVTAFDLRAEDNGTFTYLTPTLTYTKNVSPDYSTKLDVLTAGRIYSTADLPIPSELFSLFDIPLATSNIGVRPNYALAWLKTVGVNLAADGGVQLVQRFTYDAYSLFLYDGTHD